MSDVILDLRRDKSKVDRELLYSSFVTSYGDTQHCFRIDGVDWSKNIDYEFILDSGETFTIRQYYKEKYNKTLREDSLPLILHEKKIKGNLRKLYFPPELLYLTGLTSEMRGDFNAIKTIMFPDSHKV